MRRKISLAVAAGLVVVIASSAMAIGADTQVNTYKVVGAIKGGKGATSKKPRPIALQFDYTVGEEHNLRPSPITKYSIFFGGTRVNTKPFATCDIAKLNATTNTQGLAVCPKGSLMGTGQIVNQVGQPDNLADKSIYCYLDLTTVNGKAGNQFLLYLKGVQSGRPKDKLCLTAISQAIDSRFVKKPGGTALQFSVPKNLLHPSGLDNAVSNTASVVRKTTKKVKGKTVGFFEAISCKKTQKIKVDFTQEDGGKTITASTTVPCTK